MKTRVILILLVCVSAAIFFMAAQQKVAAPKPLPFVIPAGFPTPSTNIFLNNTPTEAGFALGKKLFFDANLSKDGEVSCASCHQPFAAFSTYDHDYSHGVFNSFSTRNAPALINLAWMKEWHWDGGINNLTNQALAPLTATNEMGETLGNILVKLKNDKDYPTLFLKAYGSANITTERMQKAFTQYVGSLISANSKYDKVMRGEAKFIAPEQKGYEVFKIHCNSCHKEPLFTDNTFRNNGISLNKYNDVGRQQITLKQSDSLSFKVPTLRNIALTIPYMHDGRYNDLEKVINHYLNINSTQLNVDPQLKNSMQITPLEKKQLILFLYTLTDTSFTKNKRFQQ